MRSAAAVGALLRDKDIRRALTTSIDHTYRDCEYLLVPEVDILHELPGRVDVLLVTGHQICGIEIKSDVDTVQRLPRQISIYEAALERGTLIAGARHLRAVESLLPPWWEIWVAQRCNETVALDTYRPGRTNPDLSLHAVATFMPREALVRHLRTQGVRGYSRLSTYELRERVVDMHSRTNFLALARWVMRTRGDWSYRAAQLRGTRPQYSPPSSRCQCPLCESIAAVTHRS